MEALILAAGHGSRLKRPLNLLPKSLLKIGNKTLIYYIIKKLIYSGISKINIVVGYKKDLLIEYLKKNFTNDVKLNFITNNDYKKKGNIFSVYTARKILKKNILILNSDLLIPNEVLSKLIKSNFKNTFLANNPKFRTNDDILLLCNKKKLVRNVYVKKNVIGRNLFPATGIAKFSSATLKKYLNLIKKQNFRKIKYYEDVFDDLVKITDFKVIVSKNKVYEIDTKKDYLNVKKIIKKNKSYL